MPCKSLGRLGFEEIQFPGHVVRIDAGHLSQHLDPSTELMLDGLHPVVQVGDVLLDRRSVCRLIEKEFRQVGKLGLELWKTSTSRRLGELRPVS